MKIKAIDTIALDIPFTHGGEFVAGAGQTVLFRSIIMPLSEAPGTIDRLMCAANCKVQEDIRE